MRKVGRQIQLWAWALPILFCASWVGTLLKQYNCGFVCWISSLHKHWSWWKYCRLLTYRIVMFLHSVCYIQKSPKKRPSSDNTLSLWVGTEMEKCPREYYSIISSDRNYFHFFPLFFNFLTYGNGLIPTQILHLCIAADQNFYLKKWLIHSFIKLWASICFLCCFFSKIFQGFY